MVDTRAQGPVVGVGIGGDEQEPRAHGFARRRRREPVGDPTVAGRVARELRSDRGEEHVAPAVQVAQRFALQPAVEGDAVRGALPARGGRGARRRAGGPARLRAAEAPRAPPRAPCAAWHRPRRAARADATRSPAAAPRRTRCRGSRARSPTRQARARAPRGTTRTPGPPPRRGAWRPRRRPRWPRTTAGVEAGMGADAVAVQDAGQVETLDRLGLAVAVVAQAEDACHEPQEDAVDVRHAEAGREAREVRERQHRSGERVAHLVHREEQRVGARLVQRQRVRVSEAAARPWEVRVDVGQPRAAGPNARVAEHGAHPPFAPARPAQDRAGGRGIGDRDVILRDEVGVPHARRI